MIGISTWEYHFLQFMVVAALFVGYIWGREVGIKKEQFDSEKRNKRNKE
ncbi:hypothetical protein [Pantoea sp. KPR_PJ]